MIENYMYGVGDDIPKFKLESHHHSVHAVIEAAARDYFKLPIKISVFTEDGALFGYANIDINVSDVVRPWVTDNDD